MMRSFTMPLPSDIRLRPRHASIAHASRSRSRDAWRRQEIRVHPFAEWEGFYVIAGTPAAALTGLQFFAAPWHDVVGAGRAAVATGLAGVLHAVIVFRWREE
jgi:hypothetical protein